MGLLDKAKAAATDIAAKADTKLASSGLGGPGGTSAKDADRLFRDLGVITYLEANGRPGSAEDRERVMAALTEMETRGAIGNLALQTSAPPPPGASFPPPPGGTAPPPMGGTAPPPPGGSAPPPGGSFPPPPTAQPSTSPAAESGSPAAAPPPPSWMTKDDNTP